MRLNRDFNKCQCLSHANKAFCRNIIIIFDYLLHLKIHRILKEMNGFKVILITLLYHLNEIQVLEGKLDPEDEMLYDKFPQGFMWGAATSSYQVEGGWNEGGKGLNNWDVWTQDPDSGHVSDKSNGQVSADSYYKYKEDIKLISDMGLDFYRLSISWSRIVPNGVGEINQEV